MSCYCLINISILRTKYTNNYKSIILLKEAIIFDSSYVKMTRQILDSVRLKCTRIGKYELIKLYFTVRQVN